MNEKIKLFAKQAEQYADDIFNSDPAKYDTPEQEKVWCEMMQEKFAELIVRECADICMEMAAKCAGLPGDGALAKDCADWIKKDFGVEE